MFRSKKTRLRIERLEDRRMLFTVGPGETLGVNTEVLEAFGIDIDAMFPPNHEEVTAAALPFLKPEVLYNLQLESLEIDTLGQYDGFDHPFKHFDSSTFTDSVQIINDGYGQTIDLMDIHGQFELQPGVLSSLGVEFPFIGTLTIPFNADSNNNDPMDWFGTLLHTVQDFYSHSNWVDSGMVHLADSGYGQWSSMTSQSAHPSSVLFFDNTTPAAWDIVGALGERGRDLFYLDTAGAPLASDAGRPKIYSAIATGWFDHGDQPGFDLTNPRLPFSHGGENDFGPIPGLNKDTASKYIQPLLNGLDGNDPHFQARRLAARQTTHEFFRLESLVQQTLGDAALQTFLNAWVDGGAQSQALADARAADLAYASLTIPNSTPNLLPITSDSPNTVVGQEVNFTFEFTDTDLDRHSLSIDWGDGSSTEISAHDDNLITGEQYSVGGPVDTSASHIESHAYAGGGIFTVTATVIDDEGNEAVMTTEVFVTGVGLNNGELQIVGTDGKDVVKVTAVGSGSSRQHGSQANGPRVKVVAKFDVEDNNGHHSRNRNGDAEVFYFDAADVQSIRIALLDGDDVATVAASRHLVVPTMIQGGDGKDFIVGSQGTNHIEGNQGNDWIRGGKSDDVIFGGAGNDWIDGRAGNDVIDGGAGNDWLFGHLGRDLLIGGVGRDRQFGGHGSDILIGGTTSYGDDHAALTTVMDEWTSPRSYIERTDNLRTGGGPVLGGIKLEAGVTILDDGEEDWLRGLGGWDWLFADLDGADGDDDKEDASPSELIESL